MNLLEILQKLIECIEGEYFVSDGALLGIIREGKLIEYDKDIDIYLLKNSFININKLTKNKLSIVNHYLCDKVFDAKNEKPIIHKWNEYLSYKKLYYPKLDRKRLIEKVRATYDEEKKDCIFTNPNIDIFYLNENLSFDYGFLSDKYKYYDDELFPLQINNTLGFDIYIPNKPIKVLKRLYGTSWNIKNPLFKIY